MEIERLRAATQSLGLRLRHYDNGSTHHDVLNIISDDRDLTNGDLDAFRKLLTEHDLTEVKSWIAREGVSWLSGGFASVSFEVYDPTK
jgi:hypothetical protein